MLVDLIEECRTEVGQVLVDSIRGGFESLGRQLEDQPIPGRHDRDRVDKVRVVDAVGGQVAARRVVVQGRHL
jgi:hypothetical protein